VAVPDALSRGLRDFKGTPSAERTNLVIIASGKHHNDSEGCLL
jgi:hypothetical protein